MPVHLVLGVLVVFADVEGRLLEQVGALDVDGAGAALLATDQLEVGAVEGVFPPLLGHKLYFWTPDPHFDKVTRRH